MTEPSFVRTVVAQVSLCVVLYLALNIGQPKKYDFLKMREDNPLDFYFITVWGGLRSVKEETLLLKQMEKITKLSHAKYVLHISEPGENGRFMQNGTRYFSSLKVPWHSRRASKGNDRGHFIEQIKLKYGQTLDVIAIDTGLLQESVVMGSASEMVNNQLIQLKRALQTSNSNWRIVVGFHPLVICEDNTQQLEAKHLLESIHEILMEHAVNAYLSMRGCTHNVRIGSIAYIGIPRPIETEHVASQKSAFREESFDRFLLHRVSSLQMVFYYINTAGEVVHRTELQQKGTEVM